MRYQTSIVALPDFDTVNGEKISSPVACYTLYGDLSAGRKLALFYHGFSCNSELHNWWKKFNLRELLQSYNVICINSLGSSHGTTGPESLKPFSDRSYFKEFPNIVIQDMVNFTILTLAKLGIFNVDLVFGCSLGGMQVIDMYLRYPSFGKKFVSVAGSPVPYSIKLFNLAQARLIDQAPEEDRARMEEALGLSRSFFRLSCTSDDALLCIHSQIGQGGKDVTLKEVEAFLINDNLKFQKKFSPYSNSLFLKVMANFELGEVEDNIETKLSRPNLNLVGIINDKFTPKRIVKNVYQKLYVNNHPVTYCEFNTIYGHEAWIVDGARFYEFCESNNLF